MKQDSLEKEAWLHWFDRLNSDEAIRQFAFQGAELIDNLGGMSLEDASAKLEAVWENIFVPGPHHVEILRSLVDQANRFSRSTYPTWKDYNLLRDSLIEPPQQLLPIHCLTGLAGGGKSSVMAAFERICKVGPSNQFVSAGQKLCLHPVRKIRIKAHLTMRAVLKDLANPLATAGRHLSDLGELLQHVQDWLLASGTSALVVDEMQFLTQSSSASTRTAQVLMTLGGLGFPLIYVANYSLVHKLQTRPQEDKDRLLSRPVVLERPAAESEIWRQVVSEYLKVEPDLFRIAAQSEAQELHRLSGGLFRALRQLLLFAYRISKDRERAAVTMDEVRLAYRSAQYSSHRHDVEDLTALSISSLTGERRPDLVCPFESVPGAPMKSVLRSPPRINAPMAMVESTLSVGAQAALKELRKAAATSQTDKAKATVTPIPRRAPLSAQTLLEGAKLLRDSSLKSGRSIKTPSMSPAGEERGGDVEPTL